jgi:hypothetical protein
MVHAHIMHCQQPIIYDTYIHYQKIANMRGSTKVLSLLPLLIVFTRGVSRTKIQGRPGYKNNLYSQHIFKFKKNFIILFKS